MIGIFKHSICLFFSQEWGCLFHVGKRRCTLYKIARGHSVVASRSGMALLDGRVEEDLQVRLVKSLPSLLFKPGNEKDIIYNLIHGE